MHNDHHSGYLPGATTLELARHVVAELSPLGSAAAHAAVMPTSGKAPDAANVEGPVQTETLINIFEQPADCGKQFFTLRALLALRGYCLSRTDGHDGMVRFYATRWGMARELRDITAVRAFAQQVGAAHA